MDGSGQEIEKYLHVGHFLDGAVMLNFRSAQIPPPPPKKKTIYIYFLEDHTIIHSCQPADGRKVMAITPTGITEPLQSCDLQKK